MVNGIHEGNEKVEACNSGRTAANMRVNGRQTKLMGKDDSSMKMETFTTVIGQMMKPMA